MPHIEAVRWVGPRHVSASSHLETMIGGDDGLDESGGGGGSIGDGSTSNRPARSPDRYRSLNKNLALA